MDDDTVVDFDFDFDDIDDDDDCIDYINHGFLACDGMEFDVLPLCFLLWCPWYFSQLVLLLP